MKRNLFTKLAFLMLVLCLVLTVGFVSCGKDNTDKPSDEETDHKNNVELLSPDNALSLEGYTILRADKTKQEIKDAVIDLHDAVKAACGLDLKKPETDRMNSSVLAQECSDAALVIVAYGRGIAHTEEKESLLSALKTFKDKLYTIVDSSGQAFSHPLSPKAREWKIEKI